MIYRLLERHCMNTTGRSGYDMKIKKQEILNPRKLYLSRLLSRISGNYFPSKNVNLPIERKNIRKILVLEHECIGDVIMLEPALDALRKFFESAELHLLCTPAVKDLAEKADLADHVHAYPFETPYGQSFDMIFDFHGDIRRIRLMKKFRSCYRCGFRFSGGAAWLTHVTDYPYHQHQAERPFALLRELNIPAEPRSPRLKNFPQKKEYSRKVLLHPGANHTGRLWPEEHWKQLIALFQKEKYALAWISPPGQTAPEGIPAIKDSLTGIARHISEADLLIGCDSMAVHLAAALKTPALAIFGSQDPALTKPYGIYGHVIKAAGACMHKRRDWRLCSECMASVHPPDVVKKAKGILAERRDEDR